MKKKLLQNVGWYLTFILLFGYSSFAEKSSPPDVYHSTAGKIDFYALGKPSMLKIHGDAKTVEGTLQKVGDEFSGHFQMKMNDLSTGIGMRDSHMRNKIFEVEKYPTAEMTLKPIHAKSGEKTAFSGTLKFHGVEKEVQGETTLKLSDNKVGYDSTFKILLTDFNIQPPDFAGMRVENEIRVELSGEGTK